MKTRLVRNGEFTLIDDVSKALSPPEDGFYWIDASLDDLALLQPMFRLHDLAVEDCLHEDEQRPKLEIYDDHYFIVLSSIRYDDEEIYLRSLNMFLGRYFIITVTRQKIHEIRTVKPILWQEEVNSPDRFMYHLIDLVVNNYFAVGDRIEAKIEKLEEDILLGAKKRHLNELIGLRSEILWLKKTLGPQRELILKLNRKELDLIDDELQKYFSDIYENAVKVSENFDTFRDLMANLREAYQSSVTNRANEIMRTFTAITTIFMPLTFITGVYGMNFPHLPFLDYPHAEYYVIGGMFVVAVAMILLFRKKNWL